MASGDPKLGQLDSWRKDEITDDFKINIANVYPFVILKQKNNFE